MIDKSIAKQLAQQGQAEPAPEPAVEPSFEPPGPRAEQNADVDRDLNYADTAFREGSEEGGCGWAANAISSASSGVSEDQSRQLKSYAQRCSLRY